MTDTYADLRALAVTDADAHGVASWMEAIDTGALDSEEIAEDLVLLFKIKAAFVALHAERDALAATVEKVRALHPPLLIRLGPDAGKSLCGRCDPSEGFYPCATIRALSTPDGPADGRHSE